MKRLGIVCCLLAMLLPVFGIDLPSKEKFHLILLAGQSNMAGRGKIHPEDRKDYSHVLMLNKEGKWVPAAAPVHFDKPDAGIGPGDTFAKLLAAADPSVTVGLIPTACGGSSILHWQPGAYWKQTKSHPYDDAVIRTRNALKDGTLKAILWHQGESDCNKGAEQYGERLITLIRDFRQKFHAENVPVLIGQLSRFPGEKWNDFKGVIDKAHRKAVSDLHPATFVPSHGLTSNPDKIHFDRASQIEFGKRYYEAYRQLIKSPEKK